MSSDPNKSTIQAYDQIANKYVERAQRSGQWDTPLEPAFSKFTALLASGATVLDIGCGPGKDTRMFRQHGYRATGLDLSAGMLDEARKYSADPFIQADMLRLPLADNHVDGVWMCASLLHLPRQLAPGALRAAYRVLKPGGSLYLSVKQGTGEDYQETLGTRFFTYFEVSEVISLLESGGFTIVEDWIDAPYWINVVARK